MDLPWRVKQRRAAEHLDTFIAECAAYVRDENVRLDSATDTTTGIVQVRLRAESEPPAALGATIGDVLHNLRSALDAVAWEACQRAGLPKEWEAHVYFPITTDPTAWEKTAQRKLRRENCRALMLRTARCLSGCSPGTGTRRRAGPESMWVTSCPPAVHWLGSTS